jgi:hypothetical protein
MTGLDGHRALLTRAYTYIKSVSWKSSKKMSITERAFCSNKGECIICNSKTSYFFSKKYPAYPGWPFADELKVAYWKCEHCGFVISRTHQEMAPADWAALNTSWHHLAESDAEPNLTNQPPYADQALALAILEKNNVISLKNTLDYAAGYGTLSRFLSKYFNKNIAMYDRYVRSENPDLHYVSESELEKYQLVINSAMFEHVLDRGALNEVNDLVAEDGVLMLHTVVCENVPKDPNWFYITPIVHTAFHTNKSMSILMQQWGYAASIYSPQAKSWFLFKKNFHQLSCLEEFVGEVNKEMQTQYFFYKPDFLDYWKGF